MARAGGGKGKWRSLKTGRFVSAHYAKRNPKHVEKVVGREDESVDIRQLISYTCPETGIYINTDKACDDPEWKWRLMSTRLTCPECSEEHILVRPEGG